MVKLRVFIACDLNSERDKSKAETIRRRLKQILKEAGADLEVAVTNMSQYLERREIKDAACPAEERASPMAEHVFAFADGMGMLISAGKAVTATQRGLPQYVASISEIRKKFRNQQQSEFRVCAAAELVKAEPMEAAPNTSSTSEVIDLTTPVKIKVEDGVDELVAAFSQSMHIAKPKEPQVPQPKHKKLDPVIADNLNKPRGTRTRK